MRRNIAVGLLAGLLAACGSGDGAATTPLDPAAATTSTVAPGTTTTATTPAVVADVAAPAPTVDTEIEAIVREWADGWIENDPDRVVALYAEDAIYEDASYPFERHGKADILEMVTNHSFWHDYTASPPLKITPTATDTYVVDWIWAGITREDGKVFIFEASTEFQIEDGLIVHSTDSYYRPSAPWSD